MHLALKIKTFIVSDKLLIAHAPEITEHGLNVILDHDPGIQEALLSIYLAFDVIRLFCTAAKSHHMLVLHAPVKANGALTVLLDEAIQNMTALNITQAQTIQLVSLDFASI